MTIDFKFLKGAFLGWLPMVLAWMALIWQFGLVRTWLAFWIDVAFLFGGWTLGILPHALKGKQRD